MKFGPVSIADTPGAILAHKLVDSSGRKVLGKGTRLTADHLPLLESLGLSTVIVAALSDDDLTENEAAGRIGRALIGHGIVVTAPGVGRANLTATLKGPLRVNVDLLHQLNNVAPGITIATLKEHTLVQDGDLVGLVKIIPFGIDRRYVNAAEVIAGTASPVLSVRPLQSRHCTLIISGPESAKDDLTAAFLSPIQARLEGLASVLEQVEYVAHTPEAVSAAIARHNNVDLILIASISAIMDEDDVIPTALAQAEGELTQFGAPVDPGSLMMLGYVGDTPVLGMPGCVRSLKTNIVDMVLPRLIAGERLSRMDIIAMGHGGLLPDISERPSPRQ
jgi:molybdenum cofactor cytidylyltransferase